MPRIRRGQIERVIQRLTPTVKRLAAIAQCTGMRLGDLLSLRWSDIDFKRRQIVVRSAKPFRTRTIPLSRELRGILSRVPSIQRKGLASADADGRTINAATVRREFRRVGKRRSATSISIYNLRLDFVRRAIRARVPPKVLADLLGHSLHTVVKRLKERE